MTSKNWRKQRSPKIGVAWPGAASYVFAVAERSLRSLTAYGHLHDATQRFEYFVVGVAGGLCAYVGQNLKPHKLDWSAYSLEIASLALVLASVVVSFRRIEYSLMVNRLNADWLHLGELRGICTEALQGAKVQQKLLNKDTGEMWTPEMMTGKIEQLNKDIPKCGDQLESAQAKGRKYYRIRNWLLGIGFFGLFLSKIFAFYFP